MKNFFGGDGYAGGSIDAEAARISEHFSAVTFSPDEQLSITGHQALRLAAMLQALRVPCLTCGGDGVSLRGGEPCEDCIADREAEFL